MITQNKTYLYTKAQQLLQAQQFAEVKHMLAAFLQAEVSTDAESWFYLGAAHHGLGELELALAAFLNSSKLANHNPQIHANLGVVYEALKQPANALAAYDNALNLDANNQLALLNRGSLQISQGAFFAGLASNQVGFEKSQQDTDFIYNYADSLMLAFDYEHALNLCEQGLLIDKNHAKLHFKKVLCLSALYQLKEAQQSLDRALSLDQNLLQSMLPNYQQHAEIKAVELYFEAMHQAQKRCFWRDQSAYEAHFIAAISRNELTYSDYTFHTFPLKIDAETRLKLARNVALNLSQETAKLQLPKFEFNRQTAHQKLRIGYVSANYRVHPNYYLSRKLYALHDKNQFEIYAYALTKPDDNIKAEIAKDCAAFREMAGLDVTAIAGQIFADEIDILVDFDGYSKDAKMEVFALKPAPLQIAYLGYPGTLGADFMDYIITDNVVTPEEFEPHWHEKLIKFTDGYFAFDPTISNMATSQTRADVGLPSDAFVFCCFNTQYKIEPAIFAVWCNILNAVPNSVLWLLSHDELAISHLKAAAIKHNIAPERLIFAPNLPHAAHNLRYQLADLFLDTHWVNGHTTSLEALWQGLPVLTCPAEVMTGRIATSFLTHLNLPELIAKNLIEYEKIAIDLALNPIQLLALRDRLKSARFSSPVFNTLYTTQKLEKAYTIAHQRYVAGMPTQTMTIMPFAMPKYAALNPQT